MDNLPKRSNTHGQEYRSRQAFRSKVPDNLFVVRDETTDDYGNDLIIELIMPSGSVSNFRSHIQLKSVRNGKLNSDRSFSYPVPIKTINYLLNQPNSFFVVYLENKKVFLWEWVDVINQRFYKKGIDVKSTDAKGVSYHFSKYLNNEAFKEIYNQILSRGIVVREIVTILNTKDNDQPVHVIVDLEKSKVVTSSDAESYLKKYGISCCNNDMYDLISNWISMLSFTSKKDSFVALVVGYYFTHVGNYFSALEWLPKGSMLNSLNEKDRSLAEYLYTEIQYIMGIINTDSYLKKLNYISEKDPGNLLSLQSLLICYRLIILNDKIDDETLEKGFRNIVTKIKATPNLDPIILRQTELAEFEIDGIILNKNFLRNSFKISSHIQVGRPLSFKNTSNILKDIVEQQQKWFERYVEIKKDEKMSNLLLARYDLTFANEYIMLYQAGRSPNKDLEVTSDDCEFLNALKNDLSAAYGVFERYGLLHEALSTKSVTANICSILGLVDEYKNNLQYVIDKGNEIGLYEMVTLAKKSLEDGTMFKIDGDISKYHLSDEEIEIYAKQYLNTFDLPKERLENVKKDYWWSEQDHKEANSWCRYISTVQDLKHTLSMSTLYSIDPKRFILCKLLGCRSSNPGTNRELLISEFKSFYCKTCTKRKPDES